MIYLKAIVFAVVEGATEFIPVSSTGHMILVDEWIRLSPDTAFNNAFMVIIQLPAIFAVVVYFWKDLWPFGGGVENRAATLSLWTKIIAGFLPAAVIGVLLDDYIEVHLFNAVTVACALVAGGVVLLAIERVHIKPRMASPRDLDYRTALLIGLFECLAMIPGTSRSAATIIGAMLLGAARPAAAEFSFFLAIPTMLGAAALKMFKSGAHFTPQEWVVLGVGSVTSFAVAYAVIAVFMNYIRKRDFKVFGYYRIVLGLIVLGYFLFQ